MKQHNIVITGIQPWDIEIGSNCKNIAQELSKNNKVLYVNPPLDRKNQILRRDDPKISKRIKIIRGTQNGLEKINENLWVYYPNCVLESLNWLPNQMFRTANKIASRKFANSIKKPLISLGFDDFILFTDSDMFRSRHLKEILMPSEFIYYSRDNLMTVPYWYKHGHIMEPEIMKEADLVVTNSPFLAQLAKKHNPNSHYIGQGCDVSEYIPKALRICSNFGKTRPIVGYTGLISERRLDYELMELLLKHCPQYDFMFVGPIENESSMEHLRKYPNAKFTGSQPVKDLPDIIKVFDVCINPQILNQLTKGNYPRKIDEYLASGKPVVATYTPTMSVFKDHCYLANEPAHYIGLLKLAIKENSINKAKNRIAFASSHTWENSLNKMWEMLYQTRRSHIQTFAA